MLKCCMHVRVYRVISCLTDSYTYHSAINFRDALTPVSVSMSRLLKISRWKISGTNGRMRSVDTSQQWVTGEVVTFGKLKKHQLKCAAIRTPSQPLFEVVEI
ncbi:hypothetical protein NPIL_658271 [Nephila pilipes]|uniref:Uncharacterized protein n=1 Tax=Nephila pilipes TaxID=299642 RepID=A0A8X6P1Y2_NEPPI|nr:hypothetical protein NPIL_658271 [Nephila pilipes]